MKTKLKNYFLWIAGVIGGTALLSLSLFIIGIVARVLWTAFLTGFNLW